MGMVKRVLYTATGGSVQDPEAVSYSRNKSGGQENVWGILKFRIYNFQNILCFEPHDTEFGEFSS